MKKNTFNIIHIADIHFGKKNDKKLYNDLKNNFLDNIPIINKEYPIGMVVIEGEHACMTMRGVKKSGAKTKTAAISGKFDTNHTLRQEFYNLL